MRAYQEQDFEKMATRVVDRFLRGEKLADVAAAEAQQSQLNPDQIERLSHSANTMAFLKLMEQQQNQGTPDMTGEFDPIDARQIMQLLMQHMGGGAGAAPATGAGDGGLPQQPQGPGVGDEMPLPDEHAGMHQGMPPEMQHGMPPGMGAAPDEGAPPIDDENDGPFAKGDKQKAKDDAGKKSKKDDKDDDDKPKKGPPGAAKKDEAKEAAFRQRRLRKLADVFEDQLKQAELVFEDTFATLQTQLRQAHGAPNEAAFEKDALALYGDSVGHAVLSMVQEARGWKPTTGEDAGVKTAALHDHHVVDDTVSNRTFGTLVKIAAEAARIKQGIEHVRALCS